MAPEDQRWLTDCFLHWQVPVACLEGKLWVRISAQYYNTIDDYAALVKAVQQLMAEGPHTTNGQGFAQPVNGQANVSGH